MLTYTFETDAVFRVLLKHPCEKVFEIVRHLSEFFPWEIVLAKFSIFWSIDDIVEALSRVLFHQASKQNYSQSKHICLFSIEREFFITNFRRSMEFWTTVYTYLLIIGLCWGKICYLNIEVYIKQYVFTFDIEMRIFFRFYELKTCKNLAEKASYPPFVQFFMIYQKVEKVSILSKLQSKEWYIVNFPYFIELPCSFWNMFNTFNDVGMLFNLCNRFHYFIFLEQLKSWLRVFGNFEFYNFLCVIDSSKPYLSECAWTQFSQKFYSVSTALFIIFFHFLFRVFLFLYHTLLQIIYLLL